MDIVVPVVIASAIGLILLGMSVKVIRKTHMATVETLGKPQKTVKKEGIVFVIPFIQKLYRINVTEQIQDIENQKVITAEKMNCDVDGQIYWRVGRSDEQVMNALYNVDNVEYQIGQLATTTLRNIIGKKEFMEINSERDVLNKEIFDILQKETKGWGIEILKVEIKEITPPEKIQNSMNEIINAENEKKSSETYAIAVQNKARGEKLATIEEAQGNKAKTILNSQAQQLEKINLAEGEKQSKIALAIGDKTAQIERATGQAQAIKLVADATAEKYQKEFNSIERNFGEGSQLLKKLETVQTATKDNSKLIITEHGITPTLILGESLANQVIPIKQKDDKDRKD